MDIVWWFLGIGAVAAYMIHLRDKEIIKLETQIENLELDKKALIRRNYTIISHMLDNVALEPEDREMLEEKLKEIRA